MRLSESADRNDSCCTLVLASPPVETAYRDTALPARGGEAPDGAKRIPDRIREMRASYEYVSASFQNKSRNFYRQGVLMADYEDDCPWQGDFFCYFPTYHDLNTRQLRGYFTWRTQVRGGIFQPAAVPFAYLYLYELLNGIGTASPEDGLRRMRAFEEGYLDTGFGDARMRQYLRRWMLDLAVVHGLPAQTARQCADPELLRQDGALAVLRAPEGRSDEEVFSALCALGGEKLAASPVLSKGAERGASLFAGIWRYALAHFRPKRSDPFTFFFGARGVYHWNPFFNAVYWERERHADCDYVLDECRRYFCRDGYWQVETFDTVYFERDKLREFLRLADLKLRRYLQTGRYLRERSGEAWAAPCIDAAIEADRKAALEAARPRIDIDLSGLERIRQDARTTRDSLLTEEERAEPETELPAAAPASALSLDAAQTQILRMLLRREDPGRFLRENRLMPSLVADAVNEALFDEIGDAVVLCEDGALALAEDYREDLERLLGG